MQQNSNLAYNYERFEDKELQKPEIKQVPKTKRVAKKLSIVRAIGYLMVATISLSMLLYGRAMQAELDHQYNAVMGQVNTVKNQNIHLQLELEKQMSLQNIEDIASNELGLTKLSQDKVEYISFNNESKAKVIKKQTMWDSVKAWFSSLFI